MTPIDCQRCGKRVGWGDAATVRVVETRPMVTRVIEGQPADMEEAPTFAGVYCSRVCALAALSEERPS